MTRMVTMHGETPGTFVFSLSPATAEPQDAVQAASQDAQDAVRDAAQDPGQEDAVGQTTAYDSVWAQSEIPVQESAGIERILLSEDKLYTVLAVVLIIWFGIVFFLLRTDRRLARLERTIGERIPLKQQDT